MLSNSAVANKIFKAFLPSNKGSFSEQAENCFESLMSFIKNANISTDSLAKLTFFIKAESNPVLIEKKKSIKHIASDYMPGCPVCIVAQAPENDLIIALEAMIYINCKCVYKSHKEIMYSIAETSFGKELSAVGISADLANPLTAEFSYKYVHEIMQELLNREGFSLENIVRQWNYIENILSDCIKEENVIQNYQSFNNTRSIFYSAVEWKDGYPAATGIGTTAGILSIDFIALKPSSDTKIMSVKNPLQTDAHIYSKNVLAGNDAAGKTTPKFERAKLITNNSSAELYISGTAAILGEETIVANTERQTEITIDNIRNLLPKQSKETEHNETQFAVKNIRTLIDDSINIKYFRAYVKNYKDIEIVKKLCKEAFPNTDGIYVVADICRDELLTEIEGYA